MFLVGHEPSRTGNLKNATSRISVLSTLFSMRVRRAGGAPCGFCCWCVCVRLENHKNLHIPLFHDNRNADRMVYCKHMYIYIYLQILQESFMKYCWWKNSFTSWYLVYPIICKVLYIPDGVVFERFPILSRANLAIWTNPWTFGSQMARSSSLWLAAQLTIHGGHGLTWGMVG